MGEFWKNFHLKAPKRQKQERSYRNRTVASPIFVYA